MWAILVSLVIGKIPDSFQASHRSKKKKKDEEEVERFVSLRGDADVSTLRLDTNLTPFRPFRGLSLCMRAEVSGAKFGGRQFVPTYNGTSNSRWRKGCNH